MSYAEFPVPRSSGDSTPAWFMAALALEGIESVTLEPLPGLLNAPLRAAFAYREGHAGGPQSVVVKMGGGRAPNRPSAAGGTGTAPPRSLVIDREYLLYQHLARHLPVAVPSLWNALASGDGHFVLVFEDLLLREGIRPFAAGDLTLGVEALARRLHPEYWASPILARNPYLPSMANFIERVDARLAAGLPHFLDSFGAALDDGARALLERLPAGFARAAAPLVEAPATLCHHDLNRRNLFVQGTGAGREVVFIDWQLVQAVPGVRDLSFLIQNEGADLDEKAERALLQRYHAGLLAQGVSGYGFDRLVEDYRRSIICDYGRMVMTAGNPDLPAAMRDVIAGQVANRAGAAERWDLLALL